MDANDITEIKKLIAAGADVNVINKYGATPLIIASLKGYTEVVELLLEAKADVHIAHKSRSYSAVCSIAK